MVISIAMLLLGAFLISIARETRDYVPTDAGSFDHYLAYLYDQYGTVGFSARCVVLAAAEGLFFVQILHQ